MEPKKIRVVTVGPKEHRRLKEMAFIEDRPMADLIREMIDRQWNEFLKKRDDRPKQKEQK